MFGLLEYFITIFMSVNSEFTLCQLMVKLLFGAQCLTGSFHAFYDLLPCRETVGKNKPFVNCYLIK